jgi:TonB-dependent starch-binding outer membrane protein SusC
LQGYNLDNRVLGAWSETNSGSDIPKLRTDDPNNNFGTISDWYLEDGSYLRVKNLTIGYSLPKSILARVAQNASMRIYLSGENLLTFTKYSGIDPEVGGVGLDVGTYPVFRTLTAGVSLNF